MSLIIPIEALSDMQVSFRVVLRDGTFAFCMTSIDNTLGDAPRQVESGIKLHLRATRDSNGVTLTLFTSPQSNGQVDLETTEIVLGSPESHESDRTCHAAAESIPDRALPYSHLAGISEPLAFNHFPLHPLRMPNMPLDAPDDIGSFTDYRFCTLDCGTENNVQQYWSFDDQGRGAEDWVGARCSDSSVNAVGANNWIDDSTIYLLPLVDASAPTPSTSSESSSLYSSVSGTGSTVQFQEASSREYSLPRRITAHESKSEKLFPCTLGCTMRFSRKHDRLRHEVSQHGRICDWACSACLGFFSSQATLKKHKCKSGGGSRWITYEQ